MNESFDTNTEKLDDRCLHIGKQAGCNGKELCVKWSIQGPHCCIHHQKCYTDVSLREKQLNALEYQMTSILNDFTSKMIETTIDG